MEKLLYEGAVEKLDIIFNERIKRLKQLANKMEKSLELYKSNMGKKASEELITQKSELLQNIPKIEKAFLDSQSYSGDEKMRNEFVKSLDVSSKDYISAIRDLDDDTKKVGTSWLLSIVEYARKMVLEYLPSYV
ncbi:MAG: hypothetical protein ACXADU_03990 [Promethearchaeota archaeon]|jgi:hypothetical protein